jgi:carnitine O-acetyltransferase
MSGPPAIVPAEVSQTSAQSTPKVQSNGDQKNLPKLPIPKLEDSCKRYLRALEGLQDPEEHAKTKAVVQDFLTSGEGDKWQKRLIEYNEGVDSYIEEFWCESALYFRERD